MNDESKQNNKKKIVILLLLFSVIAGLSLYYWHQKQPSAPIIRSDILPERGDATDREVALKAQEIADANYFTLTINPQAIFENGQSEGKLEIINSATNVYPIAVEIHLDDTGDLIYSSGAIYPNQQILTARLDKNLEKGEYKTTATINIYDPDTKEKQGITEAAINVTINN